MEIEVHHVDAKIARSDFAHKGVHVRAVHIEQRALGVQDVGDLVDLALEDADGARVGEHQRGNVLGDQALKRGDVDHAERVRLDVLHLVADDRGGRRVGAMRGVGHQHGPAGVALRLVVGAGEQDSGELAMRAGGRLQRDRIHAGDLNQAFLQDMDDL